MVEPEVICVSSIYAGSVLENWHTRAKFLVSKRQAGKTERRFVKVHTDPIADMLTRIRNANDTRKDTVNIPKSNLKYNIAQVLKDEGFINDVKVIEKYPQNDIRVYLKYGEDEQKVISGLKRISKPGLRVYVDQDEIPKVLGGLGIAVLSTSHGVITGKEARKKGIGGEVVCYVW